MKAEMVAVSIVEVNKRLTQSWEAFQRCAAEAEQKGYQIVLRPVHGGQTLFQPAKCRIALTVDTDIGAK